MTYSMDDIRNTSSAGLIGACVSRDLKNALFPSLRHSKHIWRINTLSLMSEAPSRLEISVPDADKPTMMTLDRDINKSFDLQDVLNEKYVVIDFYREFYAALTLKDGRYITNGMEVQKYRAPALGLNVVDRIEAFDPRFPALWMESFQRFCALANKSAAQFLIVPVFQLSTFWTQKEFSIHPTFEPKKIIFRNIVIGFMQRIALALLDNSLLVPLLPEALELDPNHEYGPGAYHYTRASFERAVEVMEALPEYIQSAPVETDRGLQIAIGELERWKKVSKEIGF